jgi:hypothetical protein
LPQYIIARLAIGHRAAVLAAQRDLVARHRPAGGAIAHALRPVGQEDVQHLGGADAVDDVHAEVALEALAQFGRQGLAGRGGQAQGHRLARGQLGVGQHAREAGRRTIKDRGLEATDLAAPALEGGIRCGAFGHQDRGGAHAQGKGQRIAQAIGEEQLGRRETHIVFAQLQDGSPIEFGRPIRIGMRVHRALGSAGRA